jgi:hypothetical protein
MMGNIAIETHDEDAMEKRKRVPVYVNHLAPQLEIINQALLQNIEALTNYAKAMNPPYPFVPFTELEKAYHVPKMSSLVSSALIHTAKNLDNIPKTEWKTDIDEYLKISSSGTITHQGGEEDVRYNDEMVVHSDAIANYLDSTGIKIPYIKMAGKTSHKIISFLAIMHTARHLEAIKTKQS